jgi:3-(methylthio)propanoyl-CoA dehydrogenase
MEKIIRLKENNFADKDKFDYAFQDFEDALDSYDKVLEIVGEICGETIAPNAESVDHDGPQLINNEVVYAKGTAENHENLPKQD